MNNINETFDPRRYGLITGSKCEVLFPVRSAEKGQDTYARELAAEMYWRYYDFSGTWQTEHGNLSESSAFEHYQQYEDRTAEYHPGFEQKGEFGGDADCLTVTAGADFKCPTTLLGWLEYAHNGISKQQYHQAQMYMYLYDRDVWYIAAYLLETSRMSDNGIVYPVPIHQRMIICTVKKDLSWYATLCKNAENVIRLRNKYYDELVQMFGKK